MPNLDIILLLIFKTTPSQNSFTGNYIANNEWVGIGLDNMDTTVIGGNTV